MHGTQSVSRALDLSLALSVVLALAGCTSRANPPPDYTLSDAGFDAAPDSGLSLDAALDVAVVDAPVIPTDQPALEGEVVVWAHSRDTLYSFEPRELRVTAIGQFTTPNGEDDLQITDLAVTKDNVIYACSKIALYRVDGETAVATHVADFDLPEGVSFNGLTFLPEGVVDDDAETLVGATDDGEAGAYYRVDTETGATRELGRYSNGYRSSGDIVSVEGAGTYATVKREDLDTDLLVRIDPETGNATRIGDGIGFRRIFGLGYFRSHLYGFDADGTLIDIDPMTGVGEAVGTSTGTNEFWGAGVTTLAPVGPW